MKTNAIFHVARIHRLVGRGERPKRHAGLACAALAVAQRRVERLNLFGEAAERTRNACYHVALAALLGHKSCNIRNAFGRYRVACRAIRQMA